VLFTLGAAAQCDRIDLSPIDADPTLAGNQVIHIVSAFTAAKGEIRLTYQGPDTLFHRDDDTDPAVDMAFIVRGPTGACGGLCAVDSDLLPASAILANAERHQERDAAWHGSRAASDYRPFSRCPHICVFQQQPTVRAICLEE